MLFSFIKGMKILTGLTKVEELINLPAAAVALSILNVFYRGSAWWYINQRSISRLALKIHIAG